MERTTGADHGAAMGPRPGGSLTTARSALQVVALLERRPDGVRADEVARAVGKSVSTAYYLLGAIVEEGFAVHDQQRGVYVAPHYAAESPPTPRADARPVAREPTLAALADELFSRTHKRSYVGVLRRGAVEIVEVRGRQGLPRQPGLGDRISDAAHATAMGKVVLSLMQPAAVERYIARGLRSLAPATIVDPERLRGQLAAARRDGFAVDVEELSASFCCVAAPVHGVGGDLRAILGISMSPRCFEESHELLSQVVREVAGTKLLAPRRAAGAVRIPSTLEKSAVS